MKACAFVVLSALAISPTGPALASGQLVVSGQSNKVYSGLNIRTTSGPCVKVTNSSNITITASKIGPCGAANRSGDNNGIHISSSTGINVYDSYIHVQTAASSCCDTHDGILIDNGSNNIAIRGNIIAFNETNIEAQYGTSGITVSGNYLANPMGPYPRGQQFQSAGNPTAGEQNSAIYNTNMNVELNWLYACRNSTGNYTTCPTSPPYPYNENLEDAIDLYWTNASTVVDNLIMGGGSASGCGIINDQGSNSNVFQQNALYNTSQCGIGISSGLNNTANGNYILETIQVPNGGNTAIYVANYGSSGSYPPCGNAIVENNVASAQNNGSWNSFYVGSGCGTPTVTGNTFDQAAYNALYPWSIHPFSIPPYPVNCVIETPYTTNKSMSAC
jgi:hypothetical protein